MEQRSASLPGAGIPPSRLTPFDTGRSANARFLPIPLDWLVRSVVVEHPVQHYGSPILRSNVVCFVAYLYTFSIHLC